MSENTFNVTDQDLRKMEANESKYHAGNVPKNSDTAIMQQILSEQEPKKDQIDRVKANLPLPDDPPNAPDFNSMDARAVNVGSGGVDVKLGNGGTEGLREPATQVSDVRQEGGRFPSGARPRNENTDMTLVQDAGNYKDPNA